jgi:ribosomal-protein-alanine N-acetyltransferase
MNYYGGSVLTFTTKRLSLSKLQISDVSNEYLNSLNDQEYMKYSRFSNHTHTLESQIQYISNFNSTNNLLFGVRDIQTDELLGNINCYINFSTMTLDLGFLIFKNHSGKGYASESLAAIIQYLEKQFPNMTLAIGSHMDNSAMHEIARNFSFRIDDNNLPRNDDEIIFTRKIQPLDVLSVPTIPDFILNAKEIGVVAYDSGGAEQISWLLRNLPHKTWIFSDGPAKRIFESSQISFNRVKTLNDAIRCDLVITGSGWMSDLEVSAIREARFRNTPSITVLDHWVNYLERFGVDEADKPQILAVTNSRALQIAQEKFPDKVVWSLPDFQIMSYKEAMNSAVSHRNCVLILLEPTSTLSPKFMIDKEAIRKLIRSAILMKKDRGLRTVLVRPHPSQIGDSTFLQNLDEFKEEIKISQSKTLLEDLEVSEVVIGFSTYALYISTMCGIDTRSYFAEVEGHWTEEFPQITRLPYLY